jgi:transposase
MENFIRVPLNLPETRVLEVRQTARGEWLIRVESTQKGTLCRHCAREITEVHGYDEPIRLRHLPLFEVPVYVEIRPRRYRCRFCAGGPTSTQRCSWYEPKSPNTKAYEEWLLRLLINSTVADTACKLGITEEVVEGVLDRWIARQVEWAQYRALPTLGIDEIALKKGHRDFVALVTTPTARGVEVLGVLPDRRKETVVAFLGSMPQRLRATVQTLCTDMYRSYVEAAREVLPGIRVVVDRFHVARLYRDCADTVRKTEVRRLKKELSGEEYREIQGLLWLFRKRGEELVDGEWERLDRLFAYSPKLERAYRFREELSEIFDTSYTKQRGEAALESWAQRVQTSNLQEFESFLGTLERWKEEISNYFVERQTSGFVEGFNNRVKVLKRRCYGIFDVGRIFQRLTLDILGYGRFAPA